MARTALLNVMVQAVLKAGRGLTRDFGEVENLQVSLKGPGDFVSAADRRADEMLIAELPQGAPGLRLPDRGERRRSPAPTRPHRWIIDPLDGTTNFLHGIPLFAVSLGARARRPARRRRHLQSDPQRALRRRARQRRLPQRPPPARRRPRKDLADASSPPACRTSGKADHAPYLAEMRAVMSRDRRHPPLRLGRDRPRLGRLRPLSTATGSTACRPGTWRPASSSCARPAAIVTDAAAATTSSPPARSSPATRPSTAQLLGSLNGAAANG